MSENPIFRNGTDDDREWMFALFKRVLKHYIEEAWGWDEVLQQESFNISLPIKQFQILNIANEPVGGYHLSEKPDHLMLDMILLEPKFQGLGWGKAMLDRMQQKSRETNKPINLKVLRNNPAVEFHKKAGFKEIDGDEHSLQMTWDAT